MRYYDPTVGRFSQRDPIYVSGASAYFYGSGNPLIYIDPDGRFVIKICYASGTPKGTHSWICLGGNDECFGLHPLGESLPKRALGPGGIVDDTDIYMNNEGIEKNCRTVVVSKCILDCLHSSIEKWKERSIPYSVTGRGGINCQQWVGGLFMECGYPVDETTVSAVPAVIPQLAEYLNTGRVSNAADRACECRKKK